MTNSEFRKYAVYHRGINSNTLNDYSNAVTDMTRSVIEERDMPFREVGARSGIGSHTNLCVVLRKQYGQTPTQRRKMLRQKHDLGRFVL